MLIGWRGDISNRLKITAIRRDTSAHSYSAPGVAAWIGTVNPDKALTVTGETSQISDRYEDYDVAGRRYLYEITLRAGWNQIGIPFNFSRNWDKDTIPEWPFDASLVLQYIIGLINLLPEQKIAADVTDDKTVSAFDAAMILQYTVGLITQFLIEPITAAPALVIEQLETVSLKREQKKVLEQLKNLFFNQLSPTKTALLQNYPNPFNPETRLPYQLAQDALVTIRIYNAEGQLVRVLNLGMKQAGVYTNRESAAYWDGRDNLGEETANGVYFYTLQAGNFIATRKMLLIK